MGFVVDRQLPKLSKTDKLYWVKGEQAQGEIEITWDDIFAYVAPSMIEALSEYQFCNQLNSLIEREAISHVRAEFPGERFAQFTIFGSSFKTIKIQLRAVGLISPCGDNLWRLTDYGDAYMTKLLAVHRTPKDKVGFKKKTRKA